MKSKLAFLTILILMTSCVTTRITEYVLIVNSPLEMYGPSGVSDKRYEDIPVGDTVVTYSALDGYISNSGPVIYRATPVYASRLREGTSIYTKRRYSKKQSRKYKSAPLVAYGDKFKLHSVHNISNSSSYSNTPTSGATIHRATGRKILY